MPTKDNPRQSWILNSTLWISQSTYWFPNSLSWIPDSKAQGSRFHKQKFPGIGNRELHGACRFPYRKSLLRRVNVSNKPSENQVKKCFNWRVRGEFWWRSLISSSDGGSAAKIFPEFLHKWTCLQARFNSDHCFDKGLDSKKKQH